MRQHVMMMPVVFALVSFAVVSKAQHSFFPDPFAGSNCTCEKYCGYECSINTTKPQNISLFRMTPAGVLDLVNKNTGDDAGDVGFVISRRTTAFYCKSNPHDFHCTGMTQFDGDDANSTDLVLELKIEIDGQWGPYLFCNPNDVEKPLGPWNCVAMLNHSHTNPTDYPAQCSSQHFDPYKAHSLNQSDWTYHENNRSCVVWKNASDDNILYATSCYSGDFDPPEAPPCDCPRVQETVGRWKIEPSSYHPAGGYWFSTPLNGECKNGGYVGDGSKCNWRDVGIERAINASCLYDHVDKTIERANETCFAACPDGTANRTSDCYAQCYSWTVPHLEATELTAPWHEAFGGACPLIKLL